MFETATWAKLTATFVIAMMVSLSFGDWIGYKHQDWLAAVMGVGAVLVFLGFVWSL